jgi:hypothetical protein
MTAPVDPLEILRSRAYLRLLLMSAILGAPISALAYGYLELSAVLQKWTYTQLPGQLGFDRQPWWWPILPLVTAGLLVGLMIGHLPGRGGHSPADGFKAGQCHRDHDDRGRRRENPCGERRDPGLMAGGGEVVHPRSGTSPSLFSQGSDRPPGRRLLAAREKSAGRC